MSVDQQISEFISNLSESGEFYFTFIITTMLKEKVTFNTLGRIGIIGKLRQQLESLLTGKWLASGGEVNKFEKAFSQKFGFEYSVMVNSGSSANLVMIALQYFGW